MSNSLSLADAAARSEALDVTRSFVVQAPAGSGKTELLIQRYLHLLVTVDEPEEVVAITFTRKAAGEMRDRIAYAIREAASESAPQESHRQITFNAARRILQRDHELGWNLLANPRRMRIQTLDAFNSSVARALPLTSGLGGVSRIIADAEMKSLYKSAAVATLDWLADDDTLSRSVEMALGHLDNNVELYVSYLSKMLESRDQWLRFLGSGEQTDEDLRAARERLEHGIHDVVEEQLAQVAALLPADARQTLPELLRYAAGNLLNEDALPERLAPLVTIAELPGRDASRLDEWQAIAAMLLTDKGQFRKRITRSNGFPTGDDGEKKCMQDIIESLLRIDGCESRLARVRSLPPVRYSDEQWQVLVALFRLLPVTVAELRALFAGHNVCDHVEVSMAADDALGAVDSPGDIALMLDNRIQHLLIDEMQDTSLGQYRLLEKLTAGWEPGDGRTIFCVGDPMQSIYRFRDAEVGQFVIARDQGVGNVATNFLLLRRNFRSGEHLVRWFNSVFSQIMPIEDDVTAGAIAYAESVAADTHAGYGRAAIHALIDHDSEQEAAYAAGLIAKARRTVDDESIAVLVRGRTQLTELLAEFRALEIPYEAIEIDRLTDLPEIIDLLALTRALTHPADRTAWLGLLHGPLVGLAWVDILQVVDGDTQRTVMELLDDGEVLTSLGDEARTRLHRFIDVIRHHVLHSHLLTLRERVESCWFALGGPSILKTDDALENVYEFFNVLEKFEFAGTLRDPAELETLLDQDHVSSLPVDSSAIQVMTMHKAKGLQFDHVYLYGLGRQTRGNQKSVLSWLNLPEQHSSEMIISPVGARAEIENDPLHQFIESTENDKQKHELDRLLYVACTRAKKSLHLIGSASSNRKGDKLLQPRAGTLLSRLWGVAGAEYEEAFAQQSTQAAEPAPEIESNYRWPVSRRFVVPFRGYPEPEPAPIPQVARPSDGEQKVEFYWVGTYAKYAGTIVHRWLHMATTKGDLSILDEAGRDATTSRRWAVQLGVPRQDLENVLRRVSDSVNGIRNDARGQWLLQGEGHAELPLTGVWNSALSSVVIDRVKIEDGVHWIIDYKTSTHEGGDVAGFLDQEAARYREQLQKYATLYAAAHECTVRTALYFPLLQAFREVDVG